MSLFDEPSISRQWVLRRLQQALTTDLAAGAFQRGLSRSCRRADRGLLSQLAEAAETRADAVREMITDEGGIPYQSIGLARACSRLGGTILGPLAIAWRPGLRLLAEHTLQEYDALAAQVSTAPGISDELAPRARPLLASARNAHDAINGRSGPR